MDHGDNKFPPGSGNYPFYVKAGPLRNSYFTLSSDVCRATLQHAAHGPITIVQADQPGRTWEATSQHQIGEAQGAWRREWCLLWEESDMAMHPQL